MKIAILSDTHNNTANLQKALDYLNRENISTVFHCGDLTDPDTARLFVNFRVIYCYGNGDEASGQIQALLLAQHPFAYAGLVFTGEVGGVSIAATHGHLPGKVDELVRSGKYRYVFRGHSHLHQDDAIGPTRLINPGALGGLKREPRQFCLLDLVTGKANFIPIE